MNFLNTLMFAFTKTNEVLPRQHQRKLLAQTKGSADYIKGLTARFSINDKLFIELISTRSPIPNIDAPISAIVYHYTVVLQLYLCLPLR